MSENFKYLFQEFSGDLLEFVKQKGMYPYQNMDSFKKFSRYKLPDRCESFSSVKNKCISEKSYLHDIKVWYMFKTNAIRDDDDLYSKSRHFVISWCFEKFINTCLECYVLDPCHYFSSPWNA